MSPVVRKTIFNAAFILIILLLAIYFSKKDKRELEKYGKPVKAVIYEKIRMRNKPTVLKYYFDVGVFEYRSADGVYLPLSKKNVGDTILILYSSRNPKINRIIEK